MWHPVIMMDFSFEKLENSRKGGVGLQPTSPQLISTQRSLLAEGKLIWALLLSSAWDFLGSFFIGVVVVHRSIGLLIFCATHNCLWLGDSSERCVREEGTRGEDQMRLAS